MVGKRRVKKSISAWLEKVEMNGIDIVAESENSETGRRRRRRRRFVVPRPGAALSHLVKTFRWYVCLLSR
jgi:hypothetical protein